LEFIGITRLVDGKEEDLFVAACPEHNYYYKGTPPITHGCRECWAAYYISEWCIAGSKPEDVDRLEAMIRHAAEADDKGEFKFIPEFDFKVEHEEN
jgi:hypothetical protein